MERGALRILHRKPVARSTAKMSISRQNDPAVCAVCLPITVAGGKFAAMRHLAFFLATLAACSPAFATSTGWYDAEGAQLKLVVDDIPGEDGMLRGALVIDLAPGWKTYWRDPGEAGVPPSIKTEGSTNAGAARLHFPPPVRFVEAGAASTGYKHPVALAFTLPVTDTAQPVNLKASVFLGVCKDICLPVQTEFDLTTDPGAGRSEAEVADAFDILPSPATPKMQVSQPRLDGDAVVVSAALPGDATNAELFVAGAHGWYFDTPVGENGADGKPAFRIPVLEKPKNPAGGTIVYMLVAGERAVEGTFALP